MSSDLGSLATELGKEVLALRRKLAAAREALEILAEGTCGIKALVIAREGLEKSK